MTTDLMLNKSNVIAAFSSCSTYPGKQKGNGDDSFLAYQKKRFYLKEPLFSGRNFCMLV